MLMDMPLHVEKSELSQLLHWFARSEQWWYHLRESDQREVLSAYRKGDAVLPYLRMSTHTSVRGGL